MILEKAPGSASTWETQPHLKAEASERPPTKTPGTRQENVSLIALLPAAHAIPDITVT